MSMIDWLHKAEECEVKLPTDPEGLEGQVIAAS